VVLQFKFSKNNAVTEVCSAKNFDLKVAEGKTFISGKLKGVFLSE